jgi:serine/threonine protein kinase
MLLGYRNFGAAGDIWSVGVLILTILCGGDCPWKSKNDREALAKMSEFFGGDMFDEVAENLGLEISDEVSNQLAEEPFDTLESEFAEDFDDLRDPQLIDLMNSLLTFDIAQRPTADQALHHPYFAPRPERRRDRQVDASSARR